MKYIFSPDITQMNNPVNSFMHRKSLIGSKQMRKKNLTSENRDIKLDIVKNADLFDLRMKYAGIGSKKNQSKMINSK